VNGILTTSWDDGSPCDMRLAERLAAHRIPATFYVSRQGERQVIGPGEIRTLGNMGFEVGAHTLTHAELPGCDPKAAREEIVGSKKWVEETTGVPCRMFCFPRGKCGSRDLGFVAEAGFLGARTVEFFSTEWPVRRAGVFVMPATVQAVDVSGFRVARNLIRRGKWLRLVKRARELGSPGGWHCSAARMAAEVRGRGGVFHLWGHSWQIDHDDSWAVLDDLLARLAGMFTPGGMGTNSQICEMAALRGRESGRE